MSRKLVRSLLPLAAVALALSVVPAASASARAVHDPIPISPNQYFKGVINNHPPGKAVIAVTCATGATMGRPVANQSIEAESIPPPTSTSADVGYTGSKGKAINATFGTPTLSVDLHFTSFYAPQKIPTSITVPCSGSGKVDFAPAPTSSTAHTAVLSVTFAATTTG
jgi:hypothetical protein